MPLVTLLNETQLKSLGYGNDRPDGASSNQPYITSPIPEGREATSPDFLLRNGYLNPLSSLEDASRLTKYFLDTKSPNGLLFVAKQELLERQNPNVDDGIVRIYNPLSTIAQAGVLSIGYHLNKQGLNPFREGYYNGGRIGYYIAASESNNEDDNKLALLYKSKIIKDLTGLKSIRAKAKYGITNSNNTVDLISYLGGPGTILGLSQTEIRLQNPTRTVKPVTDENKYFPFTLNLNSQDIEYGGNGRLSLLYYVKKSGLVITTSKNLPASSTYKITNRDNTITLFTYSDDVKSRLNLDNTAKISNPLWDTTEKNNFGDGPGSDINKDNDVRAYNRIKLARQASLGVEKNTQLVKISDFRKNFTGSQYDPSYPYSNYTKFNRERGVENGGYGTSQTYYKFTNPDTGKRVFNPNLSVSSDNAELGVLGEDIIDFNFRLMSNNSGPNTTIDFRAYIEDFQDSYNATWDPFKYVGRADTFYKYSGFTRTFNITFVVPALSRADMIGNYQKLNALTWATMPDYKVEGDDFGYMKGNFIKLIIGDYFKGVPAVITSLTYSPIMEMGFDINRYSAQDEIENTQNVEGTSIPRDDKSLFVGQLPKGIRVQAQINIIHDFTPQRGKTFIGWSEGGNNERYIINEDGTRDKNVRVSKANNFVANKPDITNMEGKFA